MNDDKSFIHKYYATFLSLKNNEYVSSGSEYDSAKRNVFCLRKNYFDLLLKKSKSFEWQVSLLFFIINDTCHSKIFDLFHNKFKIIFLLQCTLHFAESYSDPEYTYSLLFDGKNST